MPCLRGRGRAPQVRGMRQDPRVAEQQFGNLQDLERIRQSKDERHKYGRFFYRFPNGEAGLDVYSRVMSFIGTLRRDHMGDECSLVIVTHGLALRLFLMAWFEWTVEQVTSSLWSTLTSSLWSTLTSSL